MAADTKPKASPEPPPKPIRYSLVARLEDIYNGRLDGRRQLPLVLMPLSPEPTGEDGDQPHADGAATAGEHPDRRAEVLADSRDRPTQAVAEPAELPAASDRQQIPHPVTEVNITTAHWHRLRALARELMEQELISGLYDIRSRQIKIAQLRVEATSLASQAEIAKTALDLAARQPDDGELKERRIAESDPDKRPDRLVRDRRLAEHRKRLQVAEDRHRQLVDSMALSEQTAKAHEAELEVDVAIIRAKARRVTEHVNRRTATYWQNLVRKHKHGEWLNEALPEIRPELPDWAVEPLRSPSLLANSQGDKPPGQAADGDAWYGAEST
jgi:hypothetical protein